MESDFAVKIKNYNKIKLNWVEKLDTQKQICITIFNPSIEEIKTLCKNLCININRIAR